MKTFMFNLKNAFPLLFIFVSYLVTAQCNMPTSVTVTNIASTTATLNWGASTSAPGVQYQFEIRTSGAPGSGNSGLAQSGNVPDNEFTANIIDLTISTNYNVYMRFQCSVGPTVNSAWTAAVSFSTSGVATPVANPGTYVSDTFFTASWVPMSGISAYRLDVSTASDFSSYVSGFEDVLISNVNTTKFISVGLTPSTTYYYRLRAEATGGAGFELSANSNVISVTTLAAASDFIVWTGSGWVPEIEPTIDLDVIIDADYNSAGTEGIDFPFFEGKSLTINPGSQFTLGEFTSLVILEEIVNNAGPSGFIIENNASFVQLSNSAVNTGKITVKRKSSALFRLDYTLWSSPTSDISTNSPQTLKAFSPATNDARFYTYNTASDVYSSIANPNTVAFEKGIGYMIRIGNNHVPYVDGTSVPATWEGLFIGTPNNGVVNVPVSTAGGGYNLIGNPYPSVISAVDFINDNDANIEGTIYFWRRKNDVTGAGATGTFYATYTSLGGTGTGSPSSTSDVPNGFIQVGQGFLVKATTGVDVVFANELRQFEEFDDQFFKYNSAKTTAEIEKHRIWLNLTNPAGVYSQLLVGYAEGATNGYDNGLDGKFINDSPVALTSLINNEEYTIQAKALPFSNQDVVSLGFKAAVAGQYTISLNDFDGLFQSEQGIYLFDAVSTTTHDLKESAYVFAAEVGVQNNRFELRFTNETLGLNNPLDANQVVVFTKENKISVESGSVNLTAITVFDIQGRRLVEMTDLNTTSVEIQSLKRVNQVLIIQITDDQNNSISKKLVF